MRLKIFRRNKKRHILYSLFNRKWVYISYIPDVYYNKKNIKYMLSHQNKREALVIGNIFYSLGYNVKIALFNAPEECDTRKYDIIFGLEPNFVTMSQRNPQALKIYYATGAYWKHQLTMVKDRTDLFNTKHGTHLPYSRLVDAHNSCEIADIIFQIGSSFTIQTYPPKLQNKINIINQSSNFVQECDLKHKLQSVSMKDFMWFGSSGSILKGLDLVLEYFIENPQYNLHVVGPLDEEFIRFYQKQIEKHTNIAFYNFLDTSSKEFMSLAYLCAFNIFPSGSEGCPGSVITLMQMGVIPITSQWGAIDQIEHYGYLLPELSVEAISKAIKWGVTLPQEEFHKIIEENISYSKNTWNLKRFENEFRSLLLTFIEKSSPKI